MRKENKGAVRIPRRPIRRHYHSIWWKHWVSTTITVVSYLASSALQVDAEDFGKAFSHTKNGSSHAGDETYIIISFSAFLAFCILSVVATIAYFSILEDRLMKRYLKEGVVVEATVVSADFARGGNSLNRWGFARSDKKETEYVLFVEYNQPIAEGSYMTKVRKQVNNAKEEDITRPSHYSSYAVDKPDEANNLESPLQVQKMIQMLHDSADGINDAGVGTIQMLVLPDFYKSGVSRAQVERYNTYRYRLPMNALVFCGVGLALFCVRLAAKALSNSEMGDKTGGTNMVTVYMIAMFLLLLLLEMLLVHFCLKKAFDDALEEEYLNSGDLVPADEDDSSLSTGSDFFLVGPRFAEEKPKFLGVPQNAVVTRFGQNSSTCPVPSSVHV